MELKYIDVDSIIINKDKESVKYFLVLFINILKINETQQQRKINIHFNNDIELLKRSCITEKDEKEKNNNKDLNISFDAIFFKDKNNNKNGYINSKFDNYLMNIVNNLDINIRKHFAINKNNKNNYGKKTDLKIFYIPPSKSNDTKIIELKSKKRFYSVNKNNKNYFHIYLTQKELIYEITKIINNTISHEDFYNFLVSNTFSQKMLKIIEKIYYLHFLRHKNLFISMHYLLDYKTDLNSIILRELGLYEKYYKNNKKNDKNKSNNNENNNNKTKYKSKNRSVNNYNIKSNKNIKELSNIFKNIPWLKKFHDFNCFRGEHEIKELKINYENQRNKRLNYIHEVRKIFLKLISVEKNKNKEDKEFHNFLLNLKYYQLIEPKADIVKNLRKNNKELRILKKYNLLV